MGEFSFSLGLRMTRRNASAEATICWNKVYIFVAPSRALPLYGSIS